MSNSDFEHWFLSQYGGDAYQNSQLMPVYNVTDTKWLRSAISTYSIHFRLVTALGLPFYQWLWLLNGTLLGLLLVLVHLLTFLLYNGVQVKRAERHVTLRMEHIQRDILNDYQTRMSSMATGGGGKGKTRSPVRTSPGRGKAKSPSSSTSVTPKSSKTPKQGAKQRKKTG